METINKRIEIIIKKLEMTPYEFSKKMGNSRPDALYNLINNENTQPSPKTLSKIKDKFPLINYTWLLTGDGEMFNKKNSNIFSEVETEYVKAPSGKFQKKKNANELVPFYNVDFASGNQLVLVDNSQVTPDYYMDVPEFSGCTAFRAYSDSMERLIKSGSILFGTKIEEWNVHLEYGQIYGIICSDGRRYLKYIKKYKENPIEYFLLESENTNYDEFEMPKKYIRSIWLIHGWLNKRT